MDDWDDEEAVKEQLARFLFWEAREMVCLPVRVVGNTSQGVVPSHESGDESEEASCLDDWCVGFALGVALEVADAEEQEGHVESEEEGEEGDG